MLHQIQGAEYDKCECVVVQPFFMERDTVVNRAAAKVCAFFCSWAAAVSGKQPALSAAIGWQLFPRGEPVVYTQIASMTHDYCSLVYYDGSEISHGVQKRNSEYTILRSSVRSDPFASEC